MCKSICCSFGNEHDDRLEKNAWRSRIIDLSLEGSSEGVDDVDETAIAGKKDKGLLYAFLGVEEEKFGGELRDAGGRSGCVDEIVLLELKVRDVLEEVGIEGLVEGVYCLIAARTN